MIIKHPVLAVSTRGIARRFGARWVLRGVDLEIEQGSVVAITGPNGCGKSTLLRILGTLLRPSAGTARVYDYDVVADAGRVRLLAGSLSHAAGLYDDLTARENLRFACAMLGVPPAPIGELLARVALEEVADERVRSFSAGMQRRLAIARLLLSRPRLLLLDEPYSNLDAAGVSIVNGLVEDCVVAGGAALLVLHELAPAEGMLDRVLELTGGRMAPRGESTMERRPVRPALAVGGVTG